MKVLVLAPRFPSLNQPWIDTYLEQLIKNNIEFEIYSTIKQPEEYNSKVDDLRLLDHVLKFDAESVGFPAFFLGQCIKHPVNSFKACKDCFKKASTLKIPAIERIRSFLLMFYFETRRDIFTRFDLIHSHSEMTGYTFLHLAKILDIPMVLTFHGLPPSGVAQLDSRKRNLLYGNLERVLVNTRFAREQVVSLGAEPAKTTIIPQGLPIDDFPHHEKELPEHESTIHILTIGRFHRDKGQEYALLALKRLKDAGVSVNWHFAGVGSGVETLKQLASRLEIENEAMFHVNMSDQGIKDLYKKCHVYCLCSIDTAVHIETQGVVLQEAQASGCVVVATKVGGVPECLADRENGLLVKPRSSRAIYHAIMELMASPDEHWAALRKAGRENVIENFSADVVGKNMAAILSQSKVTHQVS